MAILYGDAQLAYLRSRDKVLEALIDQRGIISTQTPPDVFAFIVTMIIGQQLSNKVADVLVKRVQNLLTSITPQKILGVNEEALRSCGLSAKKVSYIRQLAQSIIDGTYNLHNLTTLSDEELIEKLTEIKGVGKWTAEMTACFCLGRLNIFSFDDVALRNGILKAHKEFKTLSRYRFEQLRKRYSPYCSIAALYYYAVNDNEITV